MDTVNEACEVIQQIVDFAKDNDNTINDAVIDSFFKEKLSKKDKQAIRTYLSQNGVEILVDDEGTKLDVSGIDADSTIFEQSVSYDRGGEVDGFKQLLRSIRNYPLLSAEEEIRCSSAWQKASAARNILSIMKDENLVTVTEDVAKKAFPSKGISQDFTDYYLPLVGMKEDELDSVCEKGLEERNLLVNSNVRLSIAYAKKASVGRSGDFEDLYMVGIEGLMRACDKYDYRKGFRFSTYATFWIRQYQTRLKNDQSRVIRIPAHVYDKMAKMKSVTAKLLKKLGRDPLPEEIADAMGMTVEKMEELILNTKEVLSTDYLMSSEDDPEKTTFENYLAADEKDSPEYIAENKALAKALSESLSTLPDREAEVISLRYGLGGGDEMSLDKISESIGVSKERVRQIENRGLKRLRTPVYKKRLREYTEFAV